MKVSKIFKGDKTIWVLFLLFSIISLVEVYSSIGLKAYSMHAVVSPTRLFLKHLLIVLATWVIVVFAARINYRYFSRFAVLGFWVSLVLLAVVLMLGGRWLSLPIINQFQPSEVAKVALILFIARMLTLKKDQVGELGTFLSLLVYIVLVAALVLPENFSTSALIFAVCYLMMLFGGVNRKWWWRLMLVIALGVGVGLAVTYNRYKAKEEGTKTEQVETKQLLERSSTWGHRVYTWLNPDPDEYTQENNARKAIARGGLLGVGPGNTLYARLTSEAHNDFIYAIIIEETGLVGGVFVLLLYSFFYFCCVRLSWKCKGRFGALTVAGLGTMIYLQALANMGVAVGALPVTGQTLPFISYGGTAYMFLGIGLGIIQSVAADVNKEKEKEAALAEPQPATDDTPAAEDGTMEITDDTTKE